MESLACSPSHPCFDKETGECPCLPDGVVQITNGKEMRRAYKMLSAKKKKEFWDRMFAEAPKINE